MARIVITVERKADLLPALEAVNDHLQAGDQLSLVGVIVAPSLVEVYAPLSGMTTSERGHDDRLNACCTLLRGIASNLPLTISLEHRVAYDWRDGRLLDALRSGSVDTLIMISAPTRRRALDRLLEAASIGDVRVVANHDRRDGRGTANWWPSALRA